MALDTLDFEIQDEEIKEFFSFRHSLQARWKEIKYALKLLRKSPLFLFGTITVIFLLLVAIFAPVIANYGAHESDYGLYQTPSGPKLDYLYNLPPWSRDTRIYVNWASPTNISNSFSALVGQTGIKTATYDFNGDNLTDLLIGTDSGNLYLYLNNGTYENQIQWVQDTTYPLPNVKSQNIIGLSPAVGDLNGDGVPDMVFGSSNGELYSSLNTGTLTNPVWGAVTPFQLNGQPLVFPLQTNGTQFISGTTPGQTNPTIINFDNSGLNDIVVGTTDNQIYFLFGDYSLLNSKGLTYSSLPTDSGISYQINSNVINAINFNFSNMTGSGAITVHFPILSPYDRFDMSITYNSGDYYFFLLTGVVSHPDANTLPKNTTSLTFTYPNITIASQMEFLLHDFSNNNVSELIVFNNHGLTTLSYQFTTHDTRIHYFGTDQLGYDVFSKCVYALQLDLFLAVWVVAISAFIGIIIGSIAGYYGGWIDNLIMRITDIFFAFPGLILAMAIAAVLGRNMTNLGIALVIVGWSGDARLVRGQVISEKSKLYVESAKASGIGNFRIIFRHLLPNSIYPILVSATLDLGGVILTTAGLSFIGFGANAGDPELGRMISDAQAVFPNVWWLTVFPGIIIMLIVLAFNLIGDGLRDVLDPRIRR